MEQLYKVSVFFEDCLNFTGALMVQNLDYTASIECLIEILATDAFSLK